MEQRVTYYDQMRGLAIILMIVGHLTQFGFGWHNTDVNRFLEIFDMPVFFYISGYFAYKGLVTKSDVLLQLWNKVRSIAIPLLVWCLVWTSTHNGESWIHMISRCGGRYWFLYTLLLLSLFFIIYEQLARLIKNPVLYVALWLLPFCVLVLMKVKWGGKNMWFPVSNMLNYYRYYLVGFLCRKYQPLNNLLFNNSIVYAISAVALSLQFIYFDKCFYPLIFAGAMGAIILMQSIFARLDYSAKGSLLLHRLAYLGTKTLPIYLIHYFFIPDFSNIIDCKTFIWQLTICLLLSIPIILVTLVVERIINDNKYLRLILFGKN